MVRGIAASSGPSFPELPPALRPSLLLLSMAASGEKAFGCCRAAVARTGMPGWPGFPAGCDHADYEVRFSFPELPPGPLFKLIDFTF